MSQIFKVSKEGLSLHGFVYESNGEYVVSFDVTNLDYGLIVGVTATTDECNLIKNLVTLKVKGSRVLGTVAFDRMLALHVCSQEGVYFTLRTEDSDINFELTSEQAVELASVCEQCLATANQEGFKTCINVNIYDNNWTVYPNGLCVNEEMYTINLHGNTTTDEEVYGTDTIEELKEVLSRF